MKIAQVIKIRDLKQGEHKYSYGVNHNSNVAYCYLTADPNNVVGIRQFNVGKEESALSELKEYYKND